MAEGRGEDDGAILSIDYGAGFRDVICSASAISSRRSQNRLIWSTDQRTRRHRGETDRDRGPTESRTRSIACLMIPFPFYCSTVLLEFRPKARRAGPARPKRGRQPAWRGHGKGAMPVKPSSLRRSAQTSPAREQLERGSRPRPSGTAADMATYSTARAGGRRRPYPYMGTWACRAESQRPVGVGAASMT